MIGVINYGSGNIRSVINMITKAGGDAKEVLSPKDLGSFTKLVLPGVGAFDHCMTLLRDGGWIDGLNRIFNENKVPILGICVGMQILGESSEEGVLPGLGWLNAKTVKISKDKNVKIPHMGWNLIRIKNNGLLFTPPERERRFYFVHSFRVECFNESNIIATTFHGEEIVASVQLGNLFGVQFHPEKSHRFGLDLFKTFVGLKC